MPVIVIDEELAKIAFPGEDPIGRRIHIAAFDEVHEIVGVVGHVKHFGLVADETAKLRSQFYVPHQQLADVVAPIAANAVAVMVRSPVAPQSLASSIRQAVAAFDETQVIFDVRRMDDVVLGSLADRRFSLIVLGIFAAMALVVSTVGVYGVVAHVVAQRTHELGIRMALGAKPRDVARDVVGYGVRVALAGSALGVVGALGLSQLFQRLLHGVSATDPGTICLVTSLLFGVTLIACYIPARRATKVNPIVALRPE